MNTADQYNLPLKQILLAATRLISVSGPSGLVLHYKSDAATVLQLDEGY